MRKVGLFGGSFNPPHVAHQLVARKPDFVASRTLDLIEHLEAQHRDCELHLVIGTDILGETDKWHRWDEVTRRAPLIVVGRPGYALPPGSIATGITMPE